MYVQIEKIVFVFYIPYGMSNIYSFRNNFDKRNIFDYFSIICSPIERKSYIFHKIWYSIYLLDISIVKYYWKNNPSHHEIERQWDLCVREKGKRKKCPISSPIPIIRHKTRMRKVAIPQVKCAISNASPMECVSWKRITFPSDEFYSQISNTRA